MIYTWLVAVSLCAALVSCKGETKIVDNPDTLRDLEDCNKNRGEKDKYIEQLKQQLADYKLNEANQELLVTIQGNDITISSKDGGDGPGPGRAPTRDNIAAFVKQVQGSRGAMQRCYQTALKKDNNLQVRSVDVNIQVRFTATGKVSKATFRPSVSDSFNQCMTTVAMKWQVPGAPVGAVLQQPITLTPQ